MESIERACERLVMAYAQIVDDRDYERLREVFTEDAIFARPTEPDTLIRGLDHIISGYRARPATRTTQHLCSNIFIVVDSPEAAGGSCRILLLLGDAAEAPVPGKGRKASGVLIGSFDDRFVRTAQGWRIAERRGRVLFHL